MKQPDCVVASDACLKTMGAVSDREYIKCEFPEEWQFSNIAHLELLAIVVMFKVWLHKFIGKSVLVKCDVLPDLLSRWHEGPRVRSKFYRITKNQEFKEIVVEPGVFHMQHIW